jgi:hypothetical protein
MKDHSDFTVTCSKLRHHWPERFEGLGGPTPIARVRLFGTDDLSRKIRTGSLSQ